MTSATPQPTPEIQPPTQEVEIVQGPATTNGGDLSVERRISVRQRILGGMLAMGLLGGAIGFAIGNNNEPTEKVNSATTTEVIDPTTTTVAVTEAEAAVPVSQFEPTLQQFFEGTLKKFGGETIKEGDLAFGDKVNWSLNKREAGAYAFTQGGHIIKSQEDIAAFYADDNYRSVAAKSLIENNPELSAESKARALRGEGWIPVQILSDKGANLSDTSYVTKDGKVVKSGERHVTKNDVLWFYYDNETGGLLAVLRADCGNLGGDTINIITQGDTPGKPVEEIPTKPETSTTTTTVPNTTTTVPSTSTTTTVPNTTTTVPSTSTSTSTTTTTTTTPETTTTVPDKVDEDETPGPPSPPTTQPAPPTSEPIGTSTTTPNTIPNTTTTTPSGPPTTTPTTQPTPPQG